MKIAQHEIDREHPPFVVAEIGANHCGEYAKAVELIKDAAKAGADAVKFQCYEPEDITIKCDSPAFIIRSGPWKDRNLWDLYNKCQTPLVWFKDLFSCARDNNIIPFASVFSKRGVDLLESLDCPAYKIASLEIGHLELIQYAAMTEQPLILSTGCATIDEIRQATLLAPNSLVLHCVSGYPTPIEEANLWKLEERYVDGISDHTEGLEIAIAATALGAQLIEKHLKLGFRSDDENRASEDAPFSLYPFAFETMVKCIKKTWKAMQPVIAYSQHSSESLKRSIYAVRDIPKGAMIGNDDVEVIRPGGGLPPAQLPYLIGTKATRSFKRGDPITL